MALSLRRSELLKKAIEVIESFDPKKTTVDAYVLDAPLMKDKSIADVERKFIHQTFYGVIRYSKFLKLFVTSFLYKCPTCASRAEQTLYSIMAYLVFFRLDELGVAEFAQFLNCGVSGPPPMHALLQYALDVEELNRWVTMEWAKVYDIKFIEDEIIGKLQGHAHELQPVLDDIEYKATGSITSGDPSMFATKVRGTTKAKPFNLTKPGPRLIPEPEVISRQIKAQPAPSHIFDTSLEAIEQEKLQRLNEEKARVAAKYGGAGGTTLRTTERRNANEREELARKVEAARMAECTFKPQPARPYVPPTEEAEVRQNVAALLREDALLKKKQANEYQVLKRYEEDLHDASKFHQWQQDMREKDQQAEEMAVHQRMVEMQLARDEAIEATQGMIRKNAIMAEHHRGEAKQALELAELDRQTDLKGKQNLVLDTIEDRIKTREKEEELLKARADNAEKLRKEKEAECEKKKREDEHEMERRKDLIRQIRAIEKVPVERFKHYDPAEQPCHGVLEEMSLAELRERLKLNEVQAAKELEDKRERQLLLKMDKQQELTEKAGQLGKIREMAKAEAKQRHAAMRQKKEDIEARQQQYRERCVEEAAVKIAAKKRQKHDEEVRLKKELKEISTKRQFLQANADMVEAKAHGEQQMGMEREARVRQDRMLVEQRKRNEIKDKDHMVRHVNRERAADELRVMKEAVTARIERAKVDNHALKAGILKANLSARTLQHTRANELKGTIGHSSNAYMHRLSTQTGRSDVLAMSQSA